MIGSEVKSKNFYIDLAKGVFIGSILSYLDSGLRSPIHIIIGGSLAFLFLNGGLYLLRKE